LLQRQQEWLWEDFDWPHMRVERYLDLQAGQRFYDLPSDIAIDRIQRIEGRFDSVYCDIEAGIYAGNYAAHDSDLDQRSWPIQRWQITEDEMLEVWPIPDSNFDSNTLEGRVKVT